MARPKDIAGNYNCYCDGGNHGTCTSAPNDSGTGIKCQKGAGDTCTGTCKMITFTPTGGAIGHSGSARRQRAALETPAKEPNSLGSKRQAPLRRLPLRL